MTDKKYFKEEQRFTQPWIWLLLIGTFAVSIVSMLYSYYEMVNQGSAAGNLSEVENSSWISIGVLVIVFGLIFFLFKNMKLITEVRDDAFYYRYPPFINKEKRIGKEEIERYEVRAYKPIREFGGWGVRQGIGRAGKAFNVKGKVGLQLYLKNGKKILFGTQRGDALLRAMNRMMKEE